MPSDVTPDSPMQFASEVSQSRQLCADAFRADYSQDVLRSARPCTSEVIDGVAQSRRAASCIGSPAVAMDMTSLTRQDHLAEQSNDASESDTNVAVQIHNSSQGPQHCEVTPARRHSSDQVASAAWVAQPRAALTRAPFPGADALGYCSGANTHSDVSMTSDIEPICKSSDCLVEKETTSAPRNLALGDQVASKLAMPGARSSAPVGRAAASRPLKRRRVSGCTAPGDASAAPKSWITSCQSGVAATSRCPVSPPGKAAREDRASGAEGAHNRGRAATHAATSVSKAVRADGGLVESEELARPSPPTHSVSPAQPAPPDPSAPLASDALDLLARLRPATRPPESASACSMLTYSRRPSASGLRG